MISTIKACWRQGGHDIPGSRKLYGPAGLSCRHESGPLLGGLRHPRVLDPERFRRRSGRSRDGVHTLGSGGGPDHPVFRVAGTYALIEGDALGCILPRHVKILGRSDDISSSGGSTSTPALDEVLSKVDGAGSDSRPHRAREDGRTT
jgi:hypothetical protein